MSRTVVFLFAFLLLAAPVLGEENVVIQTNYGEIKLALDEEKAPLTVKNFLHYVENGFYEGTVFHRVIKDFMIQGGGFTPDLKQKENLAPIKNEADNGLKNERGTIAMARTNVVDSATSQFFINLKDNDFLNHTGKTPRDYGYAVFGKVVEGMDVVDRIGTSPTSRSGPFQDLPVETVVIKSVRKVEK